MYQVIGGDAPRALALAERLRRKVAAQEDNGERLHALVMLLVAEQARQTQLLREILATLEARGE